MTKYHAKPYLLEFELSGLPGTTNALMVHWRVRQRHTQKWKSAVYVECIRSGLPPEPLEKARLTFTRCSAKECDFDGLVSSFKSLCDGLITAGVIKDDKPSVIGQPTYLWEYARPKKGKVKIKVEAA